MMRTDWSNHWPDAIAYLGDDTPGDASKLQFPGFGAEATRLLAEERKVAMLGVDTASVDFGKSQDFIVHRIGAAQGVANLENLTNLDKLPATGATIMAESNFEAIVRVSEAGRDFQNRMLRSLRSSYKEPSR